MTKKCFDVIRRSALPKSRAPLKALLSKLARTNCGDISLHDIKKAKSKKKNERNNEKEIIFHHEAFFKDKAEGQVRKGKKQGRVPSRHKNTKHNVKATKTQRIVNPPLFSLFCHKLASK